MVERKSERTKKQTYKRTNERTNERMNERMDACAWMDKEMDKYFLGVHIINTKY